MKVYCCEELKTKNIDDLLELLYTYDDLKSEVCCFINNEPENEKFYIDNLLYYYELNIRKIKNELTKKTNN